MHGGYIRPTVTQRVRAFLYRHGARVRPWSGLDEIYGELYALLDRRRDDPSFWQPLAELVRSIVSAAASSRGRLPAPQAELLASWDVDELVRRLRQALPDSDGAVEGEPEQRAWLRFTRTLSPAVLGGFLLLGLAASACDSGDSTVSSSEDDYQDAGADADSAAGGAAATGVGGGAASLISVGGRPGMGGAGGAGGGCDVGSSSVLGSAIDSSSLTAEEKQVLSECFAALGASWCVGLSELFETRPPEEIAGVLEEMLFCCDMNSSVLDDEYSSATESRLLSGSLCMVVVYKGVAFPD